MCRTFLLFASSNGLTISIYLAVGVFIIDKMFLEETWADASLSGIYEWADCTFTVRVVYFMGQGTFRNELMMKN